VLEGGRIEVPRMFDGHFYLTVRLNGEPVEFVVDTGSAPGSTLPASPIPGGR